MHDLFLETIIKVKLLIGFRKYEQAVETLKRIDCQQIKTSDDKLVYHYLLATCYDHLNKQENHRKELIYALLKLEISVDPTQVLETLDKQIKRPDFGAPYMFSMSSPSDDIEEALAGQKFSEWRKTLENKVTKLGNQIHRRSGDVTGEANMEEDNLWHILWAAVCDKMGTVGRYLLFVSVLLLLSTESVRPYAAWLGLSLGSLLLLMYKTRKDIEGKEMFAKIPKVLPFYSAWGYVILIYGGYYILPEGTIKNFFEQLIPAFIR